MRTKRPQRDDGRVDYTKVVKGGKKVKGKTETTSALDGPYSELPESSESEGFDDEPSIDPGVGIYDTIGIILKLYSVKFERNVILLFYCYYIADD